MSKSKLSNWKLLSGFGSGVTSALLLSSQALSNQVTETSTSATDAQITFWEAIVLGMVQGLTEFLPISSTAHLKVVPVVLGWGDPGVSFTAVIQLGSIAAVLWYFWGDLIGLTKGAFSALREQKYSDRDLKIVIGIALGTLPIVILGLGIKFNATIADFYDTKVRSLLVIAIVSIIMGLLLGVAEILGKRQRNFEQLSLKEGVLMGCAQALAIIPGVSRSGSTITSGLFIGLERATAARFSFLLGIPAITLAGLVELKDLLSEGVGGVGMVPLICGLVSSVVFSYGSIAWLIKFLQTQNTWVFVGYRLIFGLTILGAIAAQISWTVGQ
ncbi:UDP pyrophosphate phosphatase [Planktothricoides sp. SR001]|nr:UDP pyrophosphate phosphatase [Planktothricoides sp. SR001]